MKVNALKVSAWSKMGQNAVFFGVAMPEIKKQYESLIAMTADVAHFSGLDRFARIFPESFVNVGIAEQNLINVAAGMSLGGFKVYATTYAAFITFRCLEQIRQNLSYLQTDGYCQTW